MKNKVFNKIKHFRIACLITLLILLLAPFSVKAAGAGNKWQGVVRPGFMAGDSDNETDMFVDLFLPITGTDKSVLFFNPHLRLDDKSTNEQNIGFGGRFLVNPRLILGANVFYDSMRSAGNNRFHQWGVGLEALSKHFDLRANYYKPFGDTKFREADKDTFQFGQTSLLRYAGYEEAPEGFDAEVGVLVPFISDYVETRVYGGGYWHDSDIVNDADISGEKYRVEIRPLRFIDLNVEVRNDDFSGTDTFMGGYVEIPFDLGSLLAFKNPFKGPEKIFTRGTRPLRDRMTEKVLRDRHIKRRRSNRKKPSTRDVIFVNADNSGGGSGSYKDPYTELSSITENKRFGEKVVVYVFSSDDNADTHSSADLSMPDNAVLWGQGYEFKGLGGDGPAPILDGGITVGDNNEVMGLNIQGGNYGIYGENITRLNVHDNIISNNSRSGVYLTYSVNSERIKGTDINYSFANNIITGQSNGIYIHNDMDSHYGKKSNVIKKTDIYYSFTDNIITGQGQGVSISTNVNASTEISDLNLTTIFSGNTISGTDTAISINSDLQAPVINDVNLSNIFTDNRITDNWIEGVSLWQRLMATNGKSGLIAEVTDSAIDNVFIGNTITGNTYEGVNLWNYIMATESAYRSTFANLSASIDESTISNTFLDNVISGNGFTDYVEEDYYDEYEDYYYEDYYGFGGYEEYDEYEYVEVYGVNINNYLSPRLHLSNTAVAGDVDLSITKSSIVNTFTGNTINGNGPDVQYEEGGVYISNNVDPSVFTWNSTVDGDVEVAISRLSVNNTFTDNLISHNTGYGLILNTNVGSSVNVMNSTVGNILVETEKAKINNTFLNNNIEMNAMNGLKLSSSFGQPFISILRSTAGSSAVKFKKTSVKDRFLNNTFSDNAENMYISYGLYSSGVSAELFMQDNTVSNNGWLNIYLVLYGDGKFTGDLGGGELDSKGGNVITNNSTYSLGFVNSTGASVSAQKNFWGSVTNPSNKISGSADYARWLTTAPEVK